MPNNNSVSPIVTPPPIDPAHDPNPDLFWLPARLHPEIAPKEFKAFIEEATKPENLLRRTNSALGSRRRFQSDDDLVRSNTISTPLARKKSMLSQLYNPSIESTEPEDPPSTPTQHAPPHPQILSGHSMSSRTGLGRGLEGLESLTINDLQRLESLVLNKPIRPTPDLIDSSEGNVAGFGLAENRIRAVLRRSMSMGGAFALSSSDESLEDQSSGEQVTDDSPLISRGPGHIIRRTARTKVRKSALPGDGGGHRFPAQRRPKIVTELADDDDGGHANRCVSLSSCASDDSLGAETLHAQRRVSDMSISTDELEGSLEGSQSSHLHGSLSPPTPQQHTPHAAEDLIEDAPTPSLESSSRPVSSDSNSSLLDVYMATPESEPHQDPPASSSPPPPPRPSPQQPSKLQMTSSDHLPLPPTTSKTSLAKPSSTLPVPSPPPKLKKSTSSNHLAKTSPGNLVTPKINRTTPTVSPRPPVKSSKTSPPTLVSSSSSPPPPPPLPSSSSSSSLSTPKEKKRAWGAKLGLSDKSKKSTASSKPSKSGAPGPSSTASSSSGGFLSGLFGSKSKKTEHAPPAPAPPPPPPPIEPSSQPKTVLNPTASGGFIQGRYTSFYRLPIHVERAVYRLSHIKLANPRRALYEQVLISNLMFWYLGVINRGQQQQQQQQKQQPSTSPSPAAMAVHPQTQQVQQQPQKKNSLVNGFEDESDESDEDDEEDDEADEDELVEESISAAPTTDDPPTGGEADRGGVIGGSNSRRVPGGGGVVKKKAPAGPWLGASNGAAPIASSSSGGDDQQQKGKQTKGKVGSSGRKTVGSNS